MAVSGVVALGLSCQQAAAPETADSHAGAGAAEGVETRGLAPGSELPGVTRECGTYAPLERGSLQLLNNVFAREQAPGPWEQCLVRRELDGKEQLGWTWAWPGFLLSSYGFPELIFGWKPWSERSTDARLPVRVADVQRLDVQYAVQTEGSGKHSLALAAWLTDSGKVASNPLAIRTEVVVWLDHVEGLAPAGQHIESTSVNGQRYELWHEPNHGDRGNGSGWDLYYFQAAERRRSGTVQLLPFLEHLRQAGRVQAEHFVASVELGNELMGGAGTTWAEEFLVSLSAAPAR
jgi:hypothetical protein